MIKTDLDFKNSQYFYDMYMSDVNYCNGRYILNQDTAVNIDLKGNSNMKDVYNGGSTFTLASGKKVFLVKEDKRRRRVILFLKSSCFLLLLASFIFTIVAVSVLLSGGKKTFGSL